MDSFTINDPPHPVKWGWIGSSAPIDDLGDSVERLVLETMPHRAIIQRHDHAPADDILEWLRRHAEGQGVVALLDSDNGSLTGFFAKASDAVLFKLRFG